MSTRRLISRIEPISFPMNTLDPFLFCVYHLDHYPPGDGKMRAPRRGNGADFNPKAPYRMYHGDDIPGFPQHPHRGFETLTAVMKGCIDHTDSLGNAGRYGDGDLQWMTAGKGVVHGEMFPLIHTDKPNTLKLFQIWLNLPKKAKFVEPTYVMHWTEEIPRYVSSDNLVQVTVWAGIFMDKRGLPPPPNSYGANPESELGVWFFEVQPDGRITLPPANGGGAINRKAYFIDGDSILFNEQRVSSGNEITLDAAQSVEFFNDRTKTAEILVLQGKPIGESVVQHGPFVMNTMEEIQQAFTDYRRTQFGGWPWPQDAMIFPADKGRFTLQGGKEERPNSKN